MTVLAVTKMLDFYLGSGWGRLLGAAGFLILAGGLTMDGHGVSNRNLEAHPILRRRILIGVAGSFLLLADLALRELQQGAT